MSAEEISAEEYAKIQAEIKSNLKSGKISGKNFEKSLEELKKKEMDLDKSKGKKAEIEFCGEILELEFEWDGGVKTEERGAIESLCSSVLSVNFFNNVLEPKYGECKLFAFEDDNIPKIENSKNATKINSENQVELNNILSFVEKNIKDNKNLNNDIINQLKDLISLLNITEAQKSSMLSEIFKKYNVPQIDGNFIDQKMFIESASRMNMQKFRTKPCRNYHSGVGCSRGENCFFIHDEKYKGREIPDFNVNNYSRKIPNITGMYGSIGNNINNSVNNITAPIINNNNNINITSVRSINNLIGNINLASSGNINNSTTSINNINNSNINNNMGVPGMLPFYGCPNPYTFGMYNMIGMKNNMMNNNNNNNCNMNNIGNNISNINNMMNYHMNTLMNSSQNIKNNNYGNNNNI